MAFCKYCGTQLQEGELCTCEKAVASRTVVETAPAPEAAPQAQQPTPEAAPQNQQPAQDVLNQVKDTIVGIFNKLLAIWKNPAGEGTAFVQNGTTKDALIIFAVEALLAGFFLMAQVGKMVDAMLKGMGGLSSYIEKPEIPYGSIFFYSLLATLAVQAVFFGVYYVAGAILKLDVKPVQWLRFVSLRATAAIPFTAAALLVTFINQGWGMLVYLVASIFVYTIMVLGVKAIPNISETKGAYLVAIVTVVAYVVIWFVASTVLGDAIGGLVNELQSVFSYIG